MLAIAASAAATGAAAQAVAERDSVYVDFGSLAEDMLAVQDSLQAFSREEDSSVELPPEAAPIANPHSSSPEQCTPRPRPCTAPAVSKELSSSSCSSISFTKGTSVCSSKTLFVSATSTIHTHFSNHLGRCKGLDSANSIYPIIGCWTFALSTPFICHK